MKASQFVFYCARAYRRVIAAAKSTTNSTDHNNFKKYLQAPSIVLGSVLVVGVAVGQAHGATESTQLKVSENNNSNSTVSASTKVKSETVQSSSDSAGLSESGSTISTHIESGQAPEVKVNGRKIPVKKHGTTTREVEVKDGVVKMNISVRNNSSASSNDEGDTERSSSVEIDSRSTLNYSSEDSVEFESGP